MSCGGSEEEKARGRSLDTSTLSQENYHPDANWDSSGDEAAQAQSIREVVAVVVPAIKEAYVAVRTP
jgi:hypothetical protein